MAQCIGRTCDCFRRRLSGRNGLVHRKRFVSADMKLLSIEDENRLKESFLKRLEAIIRTKREKKNISQSVLAECLHVTNATISRYEKGERDMNVSALPLISTYCGFPMSEYFTVEMSKGLVENFYGLVEITRKKYQREHMRKMRIKTAEYGKRKLKGHIYEVNGRDEIAYVRDIIPVPKNMSVRERLLRGNVIMEQVVPFSHNEFDTPLHWK